MKITDILTESSKPPLIVSLINQRIKRGETVFIDISLTFLPIKGVITKEIVEIPGLSLVDGSKRSDWKIYFKDDKSGARLHIVITGKGTDAFYTLKNIKDKNGISKIVLVTRSEKQAKDVEIQEK